MQTQEITLTTSDRVTLFARAWVSTQAAPQRVVICVQGLGGHGGYYQGIAEQLVPLGTAVVAPDLRGHGRSQGTRGDVDRFERYLDDLESMLLWVEGRWPDAPVILLGESMGASIAIQYSIAARTTRRPAGLVLISPVLQASIQPSLGEAMRFLSSLRAPARPSMRTTGREELGCRDQAFNERLKADPLFVRLVSVRFLSTLNAWLGKTRRQAAHLQLPLLVLQGERDYVANPRGTRTFLRRVGSQDRRVITFNEAYHCLLYDPATPEVMQELITWLEAYPAALADEADEALAIAPSYASEPT